MADYFAGDGGDAAGPGTTWATRYDTITNLLGCGYGAGDRLIVGPGVYREQVTLNGSGATVCSTGNGDGDVDVENESTTVTGNGTAFVADGVTAGDQLIIWNFATAGDGVTNAAGPNQDEMTSAAAPFQAGMEGYVVEIMTKGAYIIGSVDAANQITLIDQNGIGWPGAGAALTYYVYGGEGPYEIASVEGAASLTLVKPWSGPDLDDQTYEIYSPVYLIGDITGVETDDVGGVVRITGSDDDEALSGRDFCIYADTKDYWIIRGFQLDGADTQNIYFDACDAIAVEDTVMIGPDDGVENVFLNDCTRNTLRRLVLYGDYADQINIMATAFVDNTCNLVENVDILGGIDGIYVFQEGSVTIKNVRIHFYIEDNGIEASTMDTGGAVHVHDCKVYNCYSNGLRASALGEIVEQYNAYDHNGTDLSNVANTVGNSYAYLSLPMMPLLSGRGRNPMTFFAPSEWDETRYLSGLYPKNEDLFGVHNEVAQTRRSYGPIHAYATKRSDEEVYGAFTASMLLEDASEQQFVFNVRPGATYYVVVRVYVEPDYAGNEPQLIVRQPGEAEVTVDQSGALGIWEQIAVSFTTGDEMDWISVALVSHNTAAAGNYGVYFSNLQVN